MHFFILCLESRPPPRSIAGLILEIGQKLMKLQHFEGRNLPLKSQIDKGNSSRMHYCVVLVQTEKLLHKQYETLPVLSEVQFV